MRAKILSGLGIFTICQLPQSGIGILASGSVLYRWSSICQLQYVLILPPHFHIFDPLALY